MLKEGGGRDAPSHATSFQARATVPSSSVPSGSFSQAMADDIKAKGKQRESSSWMSTLLLNPLYQILSLIGRGARPIAPVIIPVAICTIAIPILLLFSLSSGFYVWKSVAVGWEAPLYLQYGYATTTAILVVSTILTW